eukprot:GHVU01203983.1.p1 GENE.GHVU01203983.1~~GHVU01203983.1.p1  ORF type:complete len:303 (+),score=37.06 GHVU01203983.1:103-909(+)
MTSDLMNTPIHVRHPEMQRLSYRLHKYVANKAAYIGDMHTGYPKSRQHVHGWISVFPVALQNVVNKLKECLIDKFAEATSLIRFLPFAKTAFLWNEIWKTFVVIRETTEYTDIVDIKIKKIEKDLNSVLHKMKESFEASEKGKPLPYSTVSILEELHTINGQLAHLMQELKQQQAVMQDGYNMHYRKIISNIFSIFTAAKDIFNAGSIDKWLTGVGYVKPVLTVAETIGHGYTMKRCSDVVEMIDTMIKNIDVLLHTVEEELKRFHNM